MLGSWGMCNLNKRAKPGSQDDYFQHASTKLPILLKRIPKNYIETLQKLVL
jgi:hypothetical protein